MPKNVYLEVDAQQTQKRSCFLSQKSRFLFPFTVGYDGSIFEPCLGVAWLLTSRAALGECEKVLARSVLRQEDLEGMFGPRRYSDAPLRSSMEAVLQGLAALEVRARSARGNIICARTARRYP